MLLRIVKNDFVLLKLETIALNTVLFDRRESLSLKFLVKFLVLTVI